MTKNVIQGNPTKTFFIEMITRDISIKDAIIDLLDNSIDGANRISPNDFSELFVDITIDEEQFVVKDNCGGFSLDIAQKYAFRFGRPDDAPVTGGSVGRFGVGMKRALFKIGQDFRVESKTDEDLFSVVVNVNDWKQKTRKVRENGDEYQDVDDWNFSYELLDDEDSNLEQNGTYINVTNLNKDVAEIFAEESFLNELQDDIERLLNFSIEKGLRVILNGKELNKKGILLFNDESRPYFHEFEYNDVKVRIAAGLSYVGTPDESGWYIYCNDRLVLEADKSSLTGWRNSGIPKWHVDYVMFKGIVFMDSDETIKLPLTTTKKGVDATAAVYKRTLFFMKEAMGMVIAFLKTVSKLGSEANDYRKLLGEQEDKITVHEIKSAVIEQAKYFKPPQIDPSAVAVKNDYARISFQVDRNLGEIARQNSESKSWKELGEYVFAYYVQMEELEDE